MKYKNIREEELKNKVGNDWFTKFDHTEILGNIDFTVFPRQDTLFGSRTPLLWAEAKTGNYDIATMFVQLILTIGKARTFDKTLPPAFLGVFDFKKIAFVPYINIQDIFYLNDFNWNVTPSNHETKEFKMIEERVSESLGKNTYVFDYISDEKELKNFIKDNVANATTKSKIKIDKNNFIPLYIRWLEVIKPLIETDWDRLKEANIFDNDFYLADLFVDDKNTQTVDDDSSIHDGLFVVYENYGYTIKKENIGGMFDATIRLRNKDAYQNFWKLYKRPPIREYQDYIIERRDLLVQQDIRERKGAYFTPRMWVELSQKYISDTLGEDWQDEYYIWDCAAGTGNLLAGLTNKYNIYASTLDQADVNVMHERIDHGANLLKNHVFQFDFLNDEFTKLPQSLQDIIANPEKRKKLIIYINPPYAEHGNRSTFAGDGEHKASVATETKVYKDFNKIVGTATRELYAQFFLRVYSEMPDSILASFSTLKFVNAPNFGGFRDYFKAKFERGFICQADTFDNVKGKFPIGFLIWNLHLKEDISTLSTDIFIDSLNMIGEKEFSVVEKNKFLIDWFRKYIDRNKNVLGSMRIQGNDMQQQNNIGVASIPTENDLIQKTYTYIDSINLIPVCIYFCARKCIEANWINNRDQFLFPNDGWKTDTEFQSDCLAYTLFSNNIQSSHGTNHWIPFTETEVDAQEKFSSNWMTDFIAGKIQQEKSEENTLFESERGESFIPTEPLVFSPEATAVFDAGRELWRYYHRQSDINVNASFYDIREYFQGRNDKGRMNAKSDDTQYMELIGNLRNTLGILAEKISVKVYEYEFLKV